MSREFEATKKAVRLLNVASLFLQKWAEAHPEEKLVACSEVWEEQFQRSKAEIESLLARPAKLKNPTNPGGPDR